MDKFLYYLVTLLESALSVVGIRGTYEEPRYAVVERLDQAQIANAQVNTMEDVWKHPQLQARKRWRDVGTPAGNVPALLPPGSWEESEPRMDAVPALGQHTASILAELGYSSQEIAALRSGTADIAVVTPAAAVHLLEPGDLCALGVIGQRDRLVVAVDAALPVSTVADLASVAGSVTVATSPDDGVNLIGLAAHKALRLAGVDPGRLSFRYDERPFPPISWFADGEADVLIHEAIMTPHWQRMPCHQRVMARFARTCGASDGGSRHTPERRQPRCRRGTHGTLRQ